MSSSTGGTLANYNSLTDKNLSGYFSNTRMRKHLRKSGLITRDGQITSDNTYKLKNARKEHREHVRELLANAIVDKALDMERMRQHEIRKQLDELYKIELVSKVRSDRSGKSKEELYALLSPRHLKKKKHRQTKSAAVTSSEKEMTRLPNIHFDDRSKKLTYETASVDSSASSRIFNPKPPGRSVSAKPYGKAPHPPPPKTKKKKKRKVHRGLMLAKSEQMVAHRVQVQSMAEVTMKFLGSSLNLTNDMFPANKLSEIQVIQQHCGSSTVCLFREMIPPNTVFTFVSRRHRGSPFGLTINIDGIKNIRISSCCEYKHKPGFRLGGKNSQFGLISVQGAAPCYRCQVRLNLLESKKEDDGEKEAASSDEEAATRSFDIIVSRGGKRQHEVERPVSANVTTQTEEKQKEEEEEETLGATALSNEDHQEVEGDYNDDFFEDEDEDEKDKMINNASSSESESDQSSDSEVDSDADDVVDDHDSHIEKKDLSDDDDVNNDDVHSDDKSLDVTKDEDKDIESVDIEDGDVVQEKEKREEEVRNSDHESDSDHESVKSDDSNKDRRRSSSSSSSSSASEDEAKHQDEDEEDEDAVNDHETFDHMVDEQQHDEDEAADEHVDIEEYFDSDDENKKGTSVTSVISRESTMLTGNEDGRCESENKTIQFNEEVDVVHYEKLDVDSATEKTPRSDDDDDDDYNNEDFDTIKSGGERVVFTDLGDDVEVDNELEKEVEIKDEEEEKDGEVDTNKERDDKEGNKDILTE